MVAVGGACLLSGAMLTGCGAGTDFLQENRDGVEVPRRDETAPQEKQWIKVPWKMTWGQICGNEAPSDEACRFQFIDEAKEECYKIRPVGVGPPGSLTTEEGKGCIGIERVPQRHANGDSQDDPFRNHIFRCIMLEGLKPCGASGDTAKGTDRWRTEIMKNLGWVKMEGFTCAAEDNLVDAYIPKGQCGVASDVDTAQKWCDEQDECIGVEVSPTGSLTCLKSVSKQSCKNAPGTTLYRNGDKGL